jgi:transcriptional regulator with XRE-family HTH domain
MEMNVDTGPATPDSGAVPSEIAGLPSDFRLFLQEELVRRIKSNPRYSLRAFAKFLQVDPSLLSKLLNGKRKLSANFVRQAAERLELSPEITRGFLAPDPSTEETPRGGVEFQQLTIDHFRLIADWYHYAIVELATLDQFRPNPTWIAETLGISVPEANFAVERLVRLGLLHREGKKLVPCPWGVTTVGNNFTAIAFRKLQKQILTMALKALDEVPFEKRDQSSLTFAVDSRTLPLAKRRIKRFRRSLCQLMRKPGKHDDVYHLSISLYPVTNMKREPMQ